MASYMPLAVYIEDGESRPVHTAFPLNIRDIISNSNNTNHATGSITQNNTYSNTYDITNTIVHVNAATTGLAATTQPPLDDRARRIHQQVRTLSPFPGMFEHGHGIHESPDGFLRPAQGWVCGFVEYKVAIFVKPEGDHFAARMFYQMRMGDLFELEHMTCGRTTPRIDGFGHGLWLGPDGSLKFGHGIVMQVFRNATLAILQTPYEADAAPPTGFAGKDPHPAHRPVLRFR
ncbi:hypothetical protein BDW68DRAFT_192793 [Aspergillus falconensis]